MSTDKLTYNGNGQLLEELLLSGVDTLTIVRYVYSGNNLIAVHTLRKDGSLRYTDSMLYDGQGRLIEEQRISAGVETYYHRYTLNAFGKTVADSLYELVSSAFTATQATLFTYNPDSTVAKEVQWLMSSGTWYCISTAFMSYSNGFLVSVATHDRDGTGTAMTDSLAYTYDAYGNRTKDEDYDGTNTLVYQIVYTWRDTQAVAAITNASPIGGQQAVLSCNHGQLFAHLTSGSRGLIALYDLAGRRICQVMAGHSGLVPLNGLVGKGSFIAVYTSETDKQALNFTKYN